MSAELTTAFTVLWVGMITVFVILSLVVISGSLLIRFINHYFPVAATSETKLRPLEQVSMAREKKTDHSSKIAAITATVDILTRGEGRVSKIEKIDY